MSFSYELWFRWVLKRPGYRSWFSYRSDDFTVSGWPRACTFPTEEAALKVKERFGLDSMEPRFTNVREMWTLGGQVGSSGLAMVD
jgi:hypothetical protein